MICKRLWYIFSFLEKSQYATGSISLEVYNTFSVANNLESEVNHYNRYINMYGIYRNMSL